MQISNRISSMQESPIRKLVPLADEAKRKGKKVYHLNIGQPDIETPKEFLDAIKGFDQKVIEYAPSNGLPALIDSYIEYYRRLGVEYTNENILITNGGSESLRFAMLAVGDIGDEIIVPQPYYTNYNSFAASSGIKLVAVSTSAEEGFRLPDIEEFEKKITSKTRAILITNPSNPTGRVYSRDELNIIIKLALEHNLYIISDEVYREFIYDGLEYTSFIHADIVKDRVIIIDSISKRYSVCGARIGCIISKNTVLIKNILKLCQERLSVPTVEQIAASELIHVSDEYIKEAVEEYQNRRDLVFDALSSMDGVVCKKPSGAFYMIVKLPVDNAESFTKWLLTDYDLDGETLMLAPAYSFYSDENMGIDEVRLSYVINQRDLKKAMQILEGGIIEYNSRNKELAI